MDMYSHLNRRMTGAAVDLSRCAPSTCSKAVVEVQLEAGGSLLGAVASALAHHASAQALSPALAPTAEAAAAGAGFDVSRLVVWGRVGHRGHRAALPPLQHRQGDSAAPPEAPSAAPAPTAAPPPAPPALAAAPPPSPPALTTITPTPAMEPAPEPATAPPLTEPGPAVTVPGPALAVPPGPLMDKEEAGRQRGRKRGVEAARGSEGAEEGGTPPPAKRQDVAGQGVAGGGAVHGRVPGAPAEEGPGWDGGDLAAVEGEGAKGEAAGQGAEGAGWARGGAEAAYSTETRVEHKGPAAMDWDDRTPEGGEQEGGRRGGC